MAKNKQRSGREYDTLQKLKSENRNLKKQIKSLRKQIIQLETSQYKNLKDISHSDTLEEDLKTEAKKWDCWECQIGALKYIPVFQRDKEMYFRMCTNCRHRTKLKPVKKDG